MKISRFSLSLVLLATLSLENATLRAQEVKPSPVSAPQGFADMVAPLLPAVVNISTKTKVKSGPQLRSPIPLDPNLPSGPLEDMLREFFDQQAPSHRNVASLGSGFIVSPEGLVVTNYHVIEGADEVTVILNDNTKLPATVVGRDHRTDIALLKVETKTKLPFVNWGDSEKLRTGDWIIAIGNPFGLGGTVTAGIVSTIKRDISASQNPGVNLDYVQGYIQTDASINVGNSGGPMFNMQGQVVGINRAIFSPTGGSVGIGFAIPASVAQKVVDQIREFGRTKRGWLGVRIQSVTEDIAEGLGFKTVEGALVGSVIPGGPAAAAKLLPGDVILKVGETPVKDSRSIPQLVGDMPVGSVAPLTIWRKGKTFVQNITVGEFEEAEEAGIIKSPQAKSTAKTTQALGMSFQTLTPDFRRENGIADDIAGVVVTEVNPKSNAAFKGLQSGDIIVEISQEDVQKPEDVVNLVEKAKKAGRKSVLLLINREDEMRYISVKIKDE
ncbi:Do/DeqQ family serine endopeptidase [Candidatus Bealeia paramacronuclearis]|uniref:Probable periplasmic serine endoprotease DegP-like n=1 Tax=Candidatus Bealeia paramacronuclearis TaxID=1921001 RepID=A0ABZ2C3S0_9PROT|nr:Do/DeqQ family serine endopeptidase [Candidatus Bealeia paramacronuclearis]